MYDFSAIDLLGSFFVTWVIGLTPPLVLRYLIIGKPLLKWSAIAVCGLFCVINLFIFIALGSQSKTHSAVFLIALASYYILMRESKNKR